MDYEIVIGIEFNTTCNIDCTYCYAKKHYGNNWQKELNDENFDKLLKFIKKQASRKIKLIILGGEPTQSINFEKLMELRHNQNITFEIFTNLIELPTIFSDNIIYTVSYHSEYFNRITKNLNILFDKKTKNINVDLILSKSFKPSHIFLKNINLINKFRTLFKVRVEIIEEDSSSFFNEITQSVPFFWEIIKDYDKNYLENFQNILNHNIICEMKEYNIDFFGNLRRTCSDNIITNIYKSSDTLEAFPNLQKVPVFCKKGIVCPCDNLIKKNKKKIISRK